MLLVCEDEDKGLAMDFRLVIRITVVIAVAVTLIVVNLVLWPRWMNNRTSGVVTEQFTPTVVNSLDDRPFSEVLEILTPSQRYDYDRQDASENRQSSFDSAPLTLVNYWATWCAPCKHEMPSLDALAQTYADEGLRIVAISLDAQPSRAFAWATAAGLEALDIAVVDIGDDTHTPPVTSVPVTFLVNNRGETFGRVDVPLDWNRDDVHEWMVNYLGGHF